MNLGCFVGRGFLILILSVLCFAGSARLGAGAATQPQWKEVYDVVRTNSEGLSEAEFNRAAVQGLLAQLGGRVRLADADAAATNETNTAMLASSAVFDDNYGYLRIARVNSGLASHVQSAVEKLASTNKLKGLVIDLRFANGQDYAAAAAVADHFVASEQKLLDWGRGSAKSHDKTNAWRWPVTVLINLHTTGAAEALAAVLRQTDVALLIGTNTAGQASTTKDYKLSTGQVLRVATSPVRLGNGEEITSLKPDIQVDVSPEDERVYFADAYKILSRPGTDLGGANVASLTVTNRSPRRRVNEAELVRMLREGEELEEERAKAARPAPARPVISDPALARAIDLLKALAVVRHARF